MQHSKEQGPIKEAVQWTRRRDNHGWTWAHPHSHVVSDQETRPGPGRGTTQLNTQEGEISRHRQSTMSCMRGPGMRSYDAGGADRVESPLWTEGASPWPHEREALAFVRARLPNHEPNRAGRNVESRRSSRASSSNTATVGQVPRRPGQLLGAG